jgi:hypothetical protein
VIQLLASLCNKQDCPVSVKGVALTTLVAVATMPLVAVMVGLG